MDKTNNAEYLIDKLIRARRSTYADRFMGGGMPEELLYRVLENATWAPTHKLTEPWRFVVIMGELMADYGEFMVDYYRDSYKDLDEDRRQKKESYLKTYPLKASCMVAVICQFNRTVNLPEWEEIAAVACAVQNMALTCTSLGYGSYWATGGSAIDYVEKLGLQENEKPMGLFFIGKVAKNDFGPEKRRTPVDKKTEWIYTLTK